MGQTVYEDFIMDKGKTLNPTFLDYKMPMSMDVPSVKLIDVEIDWEDEVSTRWENALFLEQITNFVLENFDSRQPRLIVEESAAIIVKDVNRGNITKCIAKPETGVFVNFRGNATNNIWLYGNNVKDAKIPFKYDSEKIKSNISEMYNLYD